MRLLDFFLALLVREDHLLVVHLKLLFFELSDAILSHFGLYGRKFQRIKQLKKSQAEVWKRLLQRESHLPTYLPSSSQVIRCCSMAALKKKPIKLKMHICVKVPSHKNFFIFEPGQHCSHDDWNAAKKNCDKTRFYVAPNWYYIASCLHIHGDLHEVFDVLLVHLCDLAAFLVGILLLLHLEFVCQLISVNKNWYSFLKRRGWPRPIDTL